MKHLLKRNELLNALRDEIKGTVRTAMEEPAGSHRCSAAGSE